MKQTLFPSPKRLLFLLCAAALALLLAPTRAAAQQPAFPDWRFGVVEAYQAPDQADALGAAWTRVTFNWAHMQPGSANDWIPPLSDEQLQAEVGRGRLVVGLLIGLPDWARDENKLPAGLATAPDDPANLWAQFVRRLAAHYGAHIDHWVVWNEPDIWDDDAPGHTWDGDVDDFARLQQLTYLVLKESDPQSVVHLPALTYYWDANYGREQYMDRLLAALLALPQAAQHNAYFDVATAHLYFQPHDVYEIITAFRRILAGHELHKPIWLVETNAPPSNDPAWPVSAVTLRVTQDEQAAYIPQAFAAALAAGAERIAVYKLQDLPGDRQANPEPFGLLRMDGSRRRAFSTYQIAARYMAGVHGAERSRWDGVGQITLDQGAFSTTVLFARLPTEQQATIPATAANGLLVDMWGTARTVAAEDGAFTLTLQSALCTQSIGDYCMIGGTVYYLIQPKEGGALPDGWPFPAPAPTATLAPTITPPPTATPSPSPLPTMPATPTPTPAATRDGAAVLNAALQATPAAELLAPRNEAIVNFPHSVTFRLQLPPGMAAQSATLNYDDQRRSCVEASGEAPVEVVGDTLEWRWIMSRSGNPPPGSELWWEWTVRDESGELWRTPRQTITLQDERFDWRTVRADNIALHWYEGQNVGPLLLEAAVDGLERLEEDMGIALQEDVALYIYGNAADMRQAVLFVQDWAGGVAFSAYNTILIGVPPAQAEGWGRDTVRHELAHLVLGQFGWSCLGGSRPTWLEEGLAMYAEGTADAQIRADLARGVEAGAFLPLRSLNGAFPAHDSDAGMAYSQSYSVVSYLLETYGAEQLQTLILTLAGGAAYDEALQSVYGMNVDGLEVAWREAIGAPPRQIPPTPTPISAAAVPTVAPLTGAQSQPTPPAAAQLPPEAPSLPLCGLGWAPFLLLGCAVLTSRRRRRA